MALATIDWVLLGGFLTVTFAIGAGLTGKAGRSLQDFFLSGRNLPWWLAGTSMVATTFAADTPLLVTEIVAKDGVSGNWLWWNGAIGGTLAAFLFAHLWRRADVLTDNEIVELRYSGAAARFLRGFKAFYLGVFLNAVIIAWVNKALMSLIEGFFGLESNTTLLLVVGAAMLFVAGYSALSGLRGIVVNDALQFIIAMAGCVALAVFTLNAPQIGGMDGLKSQLDASAFNFLPSLSFSEADQAAGTLSIGALTFLSFVGFQWWASWYPGSEPGGGGYVAQRMMSAKNERHAMGATFFFQVAHIAIRPLPWILVALCATVLYPELPEADKKLGYVYAMRDFLPDGWRGLLLAAFFAAYMSTISTQLNWGASYLVNDFYRRFVAPESSERQSVAASRAATFAIMVVALGVTTLIDTMEGAFLFMINASAGLGGVLILRWYWFRVNAYAEMTAMGAPLLFYPFVLEVLDKMGIEGGPLALIWTALMTSAAWVAVMYVSPRETDETLDRFFNRVKPDGFWAQVRVRNQAEPYDPRPVYRRLGQWLLGVAAVYAALFAIGNAVFGDWVESVVAAAVFAGSVWAVLRLSPSEVEPK